MKRIYFPLGPVGEEKLVSLGQERVSEKTRCAFETSAKHTLPKKHTTTKSYKKKAHHQDTNKALRRQHRREEAEKASLREPTVKPSSKCESSVTDGNILFSVF